ncbi:hypothetical protein [Prolixibacter sp. SD074]|jgi:hypothetical protein|uniref:hypothetical protein n=1 Tax=Prolixibacter sp. SD074 TaxID=2652391 RepID=UPI00127531B1|nr:hypothetical protein [Prolixibacter sp. SD074]GET28781.1 hypothetical protein SD074_09830 [Prolixibacter sp. SD074]
MDYLKILLDGICSPNEREHLEKYFIREQKKAEEEYFEAEEFFSGLNKAVEHLEYFVNKRVNEQKGEFYLMKMAKSKEHREYAEDELKLFNPDNYPFNLAHLDREHSRIGITIGFSYIAVIKEAINKAKGALPPQQPKEETRQETPKTFEELFTHQEEKLINDCIDVLKRVEPPILTENNKYNLGSKSKGAIVAWVKALKAKGFLRSNISDPIIAKHLNTRFGGLELGEDGRTLRNLETTSYNKYYTNLLNLLPDLPLSTEGKNR